MSTAVIKALTKRIRLRIGSNEEAARAAGVSPGVWSHYESADKPETTIPLGRLHQMSLTAAERKEIIDLFTEADDHAVESLMDEASEATEATAALQGLVRLATKDGRVTETEARRIRDAALAAKSQINDVLKGVGK
ncbi:hypothetical protein [Brevundimonas diminuta]|uniref:hypothetical protein n=1 Tax=Brevundimonas diminuta TaxID=293 RepID=UPI0025A4DE87|nr:hypothetical protein [Brevundimonas diminuta]MDM8352876.1 hypothetical protein [Brevundimonas diminuta]